MEPHRPFCVEDPVREEQFRTQIPKLRLLTTVPLAPGEEWGTRAEFSPLVEQRDIDFARASLPNVGGITEMLKIMAVCDTHKVGIVPHFTGPIATAGAHAHDDGVPRSGADGIQPGRAPGALPARIPRVPQRQGVAERSARAWASPWTRKQLTFVEAMTEGVPGVTQRRLDGSLTHW